MANSLCHYFIFVCLLCWLYLYLSKNSVMNLVTTFTIFPNPLDFCHVSIFIFCTQSLFDSLSSTTIHRELRYTGV